MKKINKLKLIKRINSTIVIASVPHKIEAISCHVCKKTIIYYGDPLKAQLEYQLEIGNKVSLSYYAMLVDEDVFLLCSSECYDILETVPCH